MFEAPQGRVQSWPRVAAAVLIAFAAIVTGAAAQERPDQHKPPKNQRLLRSQWDRRAIGLETPAIRASKLVDVTVGLVDTGVDLGHPDLRGRLWHNPRATPAPLAQGVVPRRAPGWDLIAETPRPQDIGGHSTVVSGVIGAENGNGIGIDGVAPNARLMALRACTKPPTTAIVCTDSTYAAAINWAVSHGARVVNMSWSVGGGPAVSAAVAANPQALFVAGAENGAGIDVDKAGVKHNCELPYANLICVAASSRGGGTAPCTNIGPVSVDLAAPGFGVTTTLLGGRYLRDSPCGVTFAVPHVTGVAALLFGAVPGAGVRAVKQALLEGAKPSPAFRGKTVTGGILDATRSLKILRGRR
jgi:subtilisin family serine protease